MQVINSTAWRSAILQAAVAAALMPTAVARFPAHAPHPTSNKRSAVTCVSNRHIHTELCYASIVSLCGCRTSQVPVNQSPDEVHVFKFDEVECLNAQESCRMASRRG